MENRNENQVRFPTSEELYAFEREARRLRAAELLRLMGAATNALRSYFTLKPKAMKHA